MSDRIEAEFHSVGVARVIVAMKRPAGAFAAAAGTIAGAAASSGAGALLSALTAHFTSSPRSQPSLLWEAASALKKRALGRAAAALTAGASVLKTAASVRAVIDQPRIYRNLGIMLGTVDRAGLAALVGDARVGSVSAAPALSLIRPSNVAAATASPKIGWGARRIGAPALWKKGLTGQGIVVGHLDTGVDGAHPSLAPAIASFAEFDDLGFQRSPAPAAHDSGDHGTHTAATIAGRPTGKVKPGVAPGVKLAAGLVIEGGDVVARVLAGMDWVVGQGARILNMSLGLRGYWDEFLPVTQTLRSLGVLPVFAVGNEGSGTSRSPGNYEESLSIGASDRKDQIAWFSSSQELLQPTRTVPDLVAPGVDIVSAAPGGGWQSMDGSSMATPHVSGLAALLLEAKPSATVDELEAAILASCVRPASMSAVAGGRGVPNGPRALAALIA